MTAYQENASQVLGDQVDEVGLPELLTLNDEGGQLLGAPNLGAGDALRTKLDHQLLSMKDSNVLGQQIQDGKIASWFLRESPPEMTSDDRERLYVTVEQGFTARRVVASRHLRLVVGIANDFANNNWRFDKDRRDEMIGVGNVALMQSLNGYQHEAGRHITGFLRRSVLNAMLFEVGVIARRNTGMSHKMQRQLRKVNAEYVNAQDAGENISYIEAANRVGISSERLAMLLKLKSNVTERLDAALNHKDDSIALLDRLEDETAQDEIQAVEDNIAIDQIWHVARDLRRKHLLSEKEWTVLVGRFGVGVTQDELAESLGYVSQTAISVIEKQVTDKIRKEIENPGSTAKKADKDFRIVETATDLLEVMGVTTETEVDIVETARYILDHADITKLQRQTMHALLGTDRDGDPRRPHEVAKRRGVTYRAIYAARESAMKRILAEWQKKQATSA